MQNTLDFFLSKCDQITSTPADTKPLWGTMSLHHMVEHVLGSWRISNGRARVGTVLPEEEVARRREFLFSDTPYARNIENPVFGNGLQPLRKPDVPAAIAQLRDEMEVFFEYHRSHPDALEIHPVFGALDFDGWMKFQHKHMGHHFAQFGNDW